ncbi:kinase-like domain-containing protein [Gymnopilus junonius]|uniref:Kinase-like domain-containing protein n=1 Tax=Gymnopilus junonius TaxID=109634 RepID=A0A9P5P0H5_GYMJU|nr:kinase-like domain-containing protein [Gymnopilus junonius]
MGAMEGNLYQLIKTRKGRPFAGGLVSSILHQTLLGLDWLHCNSFIHRDVVPENILVTTQGIFDYQTVPVNPEAVTSANTATEKDVIVIIKLCDFGLARHSDSSGPYTEYVTVRWYRAPEVFLFAPHYTTAVDMWAVGVVAAEVLKLAPLFPGTDQMDQLHRFFSVLGSPSDEARVDSSGNPLDGGAWPAGIELARVHGVQFPVVAYKIVLTI